MLSCTSESTWELSRAGMALLLSSRCVHAGPRAAPPCPCSALALRSKDFVPLPRAACPLGPGRGPPSPLRSAAVRAINNNNSSELTPAFDLVNYLECRVHNGGPSRSIRPLSCRPVALALTHRSYPAVELSRHGHFDGHIINLRILDRPGHVLPVHVGEPQPQQGPACAIRPGVQRVRARQCAGIAAHALCPARAGNFEVSALQSKLRGTPTAVRCSPRLTALTLQLRPCCDTHPMAAAKPVAAGRAQGRPLTHDLYKDTLEKLGYRVRGGPAARRVHRLAGWPRGVAACPPAARQGRLRSRLGGTQVTRVLAVTAMVHNVYLARLHLSKPGRSGAADELDIDARPSDAINMAVRFNAPMCATRCPCTGQPRGFGQHSSQVLYHSAGARSKARYRWAGASLCNRLSL